LDLVHTIHQDPDSTPGHSALNWSHPTNCRGSYGIFNGKNFYILLFFSNSSVSFNCLGLVNNYYYIYFANVPRVKCKLYGSSSFFCKKRKLEPRVCSSKKQERASRLFQVNRYPGFEPFTLFGMELPVWLSSLVFVPYNNGFT